MDLKNRTAHPHQEIRGVPPPPRATTPTGKGGKTNYNLPLQGRQWIYKLNILYTSPLRAKEQNDKWDQNLVNTDLDM